MRGISEERLKEIVEDYPPDHRNHRTAKYFIATECQELQEPWMTLDEFLESGFEGECWLHLINDEIKIAYAFNEFYYSFTCKEYESFQLRSITHVRPIHKPEPPR